MSEQEASVRKIFRSRKDRVIAGVCGGVAEHFNVDPVWVRIGWVLCVFAKGLGLIAYVLCWILIPEKEEAVAAGGGPGTAGAEGTTAGAEAGGDSGVAQRLTSSQPRVVIGVILIALGCIFGVSAFVPFFHDTVFWAFVCIVLGVVLLARR